MEDYSRLSRDELIVKCSELFLKLNNRNKNFQEISQPKLLLVEGPDDKYFFMELIRILQIENIQIEKIDGKTNLETFLKTLQVITGYNRVNSIGIILDADLDINATFESIKRILRKLNYPIPDRLNLPKVGAIQVSIYIMPDCIRNGDLETLLLDAINDNQIIPCIDGFHNCVHEVQEDFIVTTKSKIYSYLAVQNESAVRIGEAAKCGYLCLESPTYTPLKEFLLSL